jgi:hypothetical protein
MIEFHMYFDESGTHASSPVLVMGGLLGSVEQFATFRTSLDEIRQHYGFDIFHAVEMKGGRKDFQAWLPEKQLSLTVAFDKLISETLIAAAASSIDKVEYNTHYFNDQQFPDVPKDSIYGLCFRMFLIAFLERIETVHRYRRTPYVVHVTVENGDPNCQDAKRIFEETKALAVTLFGADPLGTFHTATKQECPELMIADFMAYTRFMMHTRNLEESTLSDEDLVTLGLPVAQPDAAPSKVIWISFDPGVLKQLPAHLAEMARRQHTARSVDS